MTKNIRRFATVLTLTAVLGATPAAFAGPRDRGGDVSDRPAIVRMMQKLVQKLFGITATSIDPTIPIPPENK